MKRFLAIILNIVILQGCYFKKNTTNERPIARVVGGRNVDIKNYPFQLCIIIKKGYGINSVDFRGAAVIVSKYWALTAGHCVQYISTKMFSVGMVYLRGNATYWKSSRYRIDHLVILNYIHPDYDEDTSDFDLALLKVKTPFQGRYERPIKVASKQYTYPINKKATISGWGYTSNEQDHPEPHLRAADVQILNYSTCKRIYAQADNVKVTYRMMCAWDKGRDACIYDSGGPLVYNNVLIGLVSWGMRCASEVFPGVYSKLSTYYTWIKNYEKQKRIGLNILFTPNVRRRGKPIKSKKYRVN